MITSHVPVPVHAPNHPAKAEPVAAVAINVTVVPLFTDVLQVLTAAIVQETPARFVLTNPFPTPAPFSVNSYDVETSATTVAPAVTVTVVWSDHTSASPLNPRTVTV